jgi:hypothetical protein
LLLAVGYNFEQPLRDQCSLIQNCIMSIYPKGNGPMINWLVNHGADVEAVFTSGRWKGKTVMNAIAKEPGLKDVCAEVVDRYLMEHPGKAFD